MQTAPTPLDHMCAIVSLDILEMDKIAQVKLIHIRGVHVYVDCSIELTARRVQRIELKCFTRELLKTES